MISRIAFGLAEMLSAELYSSKFGTQTRSAASRLPALKVVNVTSE